MSAVGIETSGSHNRREFIKLSTMTGIGAALGGLNVTATAAPVRKMQAASARLFSTPPMERVRIGFVGVGGMGTNHVNQLMKVEGAEIHAVCDIREKHANRAADIIEKAGQKRPRLYTRGDEDFRRMCETEDLDLVYTATPW